MPLLDDVFREASAWTEGRLPEARLLTVVYKRSSFIWVHSSFFFLSVKSWAGPRRRCWTTC